MVSDIPSLLTKFLGRLYFFYQCFTNCDSLPASGTFGISSLNNFLTNGCIKAIDASGTNFELVLNGTSFHAEMSFRYYVETGFAINYVYVGLDYLVSPRSNSALRHAVYFYCAKCLFEREIFSLQHLYKLLMTSS